MKIKQIKTLITECESIIHDDIVIMNGNLEKYIENAEEEGLNEIKENLTEAQKNLDEAERYLRTANDHFKKAGRLLKSKQLADA